MATLQERLQELIPQWRETRAKLIKEKGDIALGEATVKQAFGGMRGVKGMVCDTSVVYPDKGAHGEGGLHIRGHHLLEIKELWPEQTFILLLTGDIKARDDEMVKAFQQEMDRRAQIPQYVYDVLEAMPEDSHPMAMLNTAILVMEKESSFRQWYEKGMSKADYWIPTLDDSLDLLAKLPGIAAAVYRLHYNKGDYINWTS
ncbi:MAG: citrate (Si)-synthase, partial [Deltaproteobacteria bacterium]|nr:citrate (Si)-synthase [Deltaproteobacteria bacterium]